MKTCNKCKSELPSESRYCLSCGCKVEEAELGDKIETICYNYFASGILFGFLRTNKNKKIKKFVNKFLKKLEEAPKLYDICLNPLNQLFPELNKNESKILNEKVKSR